MDDFFGVGGENQWNPTQSLLEGLGPTPFDDIPARHAWFFNTIAGQVKKRGVVDQAASAAYRGTSFDDMKLDFRKQQAAKLAFDVAQTAKDDEVDDIISKLNTEMGAAPQVPQEPALRQPSIEQSVFAGLGALANPSYAFDIAATPFQSRLLEQDQEYKKALQTYEIENRNHQNRIDNIQQLAALQLNRIDKQSAGALKADQEAIKQLLSTIRAGGPEARRSAALQLAGYKGYENWGLYADSIGAPTPKELKELAGVDEIGSEIDLNDKKGDEVVARTNKINQVDIPTGLENLKEKRELFPFVKEKAHLANLISEETLSLARKRNKWYDKDLASRLNDRAARADVAKGRLAEAIRTNDIKAQQFETKSTLDALKGAVNAGKTALSSLASQLNTLRGRRTQLEKQLKTSTDDDKVRASIEEQLKLNQDRMQSLNDAYNEESAKMKKYQEDLRRVSSLPTQPSQGGGNWQERAARLQSLGWDKEKIVRYLQQKGLVK